MATHENNVLTWFISAKFNYNHKPEVRLWRQVIIQAFIDASIKSTKKREYRILKTLALSWLTSRSEEFYHTCNLAEVDPEYIIASAKKMHYDHKMGKKFMPKL
jgi:hypothetical protein